MVSNSQKDALWVRFAQTSAEDILFGYGAGEPCCDIVGDSQGMVDAIFINLLPQMQIGEVIQQFGEPKYVSGMVHQTKVILLYLFFPEYSTILNVMLEHEDNDGVFNEQSPVVAVAYYSDKRMQHIISANPLDNWKGYLSYLTYMDGEFDNNP